MNTVADTRADTRSDKEQDRVEVVPQQPDIAPEAALVELGKVSETRGGWLGPKLDIGGGFQHY